MTLLSTVWRPLARRAARRYVTGSAADGALAACRRLNELGYATTIGYWNDASLEPDRVRDEYVTLIHRLSGEGVPAAIAAKPPALGNSVALAKEVAEAASAARLRIGFDSLQPEAADPAFAVVADLVSLGLSLSCTLPARWRRSVDDAERAVRWGLGVRLVKGQWRDSAGGYEGTESRFVALAERLAGRAAHVAVATHDATLARAALGRLMGSGTSCELELLLALPPWPVLEAANEVDVPVRVYVPYGSGSLPYRPADGRRRPELLWWSVRDAAIGAPGRLGDPARWPARAARGEGAAPDS